MLWMHVISIHHMHGVSTARLDASETRYFSTVESGCLPCRSPTRDKCKTTAGRGLVHDCSYQSHRL